MKTKQFLFVFVLLLCGTLASWAGFKDFSVQVSNQNGRQVTAKIAK